MASPTHTVSPRRRRDESGYALFELLWVLVFSILIVGLPLTLAVTVFHDQDETASRSASSAQAQLGLDRLMEDFREAKSATITSTGMVATAIVTIPTQRATLASPVLAPTQVTWTCTVGASCTRQVGSTGNAFPMIAGVRMVSFTPTYPLTGGTVPVHVDVALQAAVLDSQQGQTRAISMGTSGATGATVERTATFTAGTDLRNLG